MTESIATPDVDESAQAAPDRSGEADAPEAVRQLDPRIIHVQEISHAIFTGVLLVVGVVTTVIPLIAGHRRLVTFVAVPAATLIVTGAIWLLGRRFIHASFRHTSYIVDADGIEIRRGVFWRTRNRVPRSRIQHTDVTQGPLARAYELATLVLYTAGAEHARIALDGLAFETALELRSDLLRNDAAPVADVADESPGGTPQIPQPATAHPEPDDGRR